jgi:hypothetical protein
MADYPILWAARQCRGAKSNSSRFTASPAGKKTSLKNHGYKLAFTQAVINSLVSEFHAF